jgi:hypothetical protein
LALLTDIVHEWNSMDSKTRVLMALSHQKPDRAPFNFWMDRHMNVPWKNIGKMAYAVKEKCLYD